jgi:hypothetical protein
MLLSKAVIFSERDWKKMFFKNWTRFYRCFTLSARGFDRATFRLLALPSYRGPQHILYRQHFIKMTSRTWQSYSTHRQTFTCKFIEVVPNVIGLVIVPSVFVVNELDIFWKEQREEDLISTGQRPVTLLMINLCIINPLSSLSLV